MTAGRLKQTLGALADLRAQRAFFQRTIVRRVFLTVAILLIVAQQISFGRLREDPDPFYRNVLNLGVSHQRYFAFFYYFGGFPVDLSGQKTSTLIETRATLDALGSTLAPAPSIYNRASIFLFYPDAWLKGRPDTAEMRTGHAIWFTLALLSVFVALSYAGLPLLGLCVALLCGSDPFQVFELYHVSASTIFPTVISTGLIVIAACVVLSSDRGGRRWTLSIVLACLVGVIGALQYEIRLEGVGVFAGAAFCLACCVPQTARRKLVLAGLVLVSALWTNGLVNAYFRASLATANAIVVSHGGTAGAAGEPYYATPWWALWSGLGDFDEKYGFLADDRAGISYYYSQNASRYSELMHRDNYLATAVHDPVWFAGILGGRLNRVVLHNTPYRLSAGSRYVDMPLPPLLVTVLGVVLMLAGAFDGRRTLIRNVSILFVLPLSVGLVAVGQLADYGLQFYVITHLFILAYVLCCALEPILALAPPSHDA